MTEYKEGNGERMKFDTTEMKWREVNEEKNRETKRQDSSLHGSRPCSVAASRYEDDRMNTGQWR